METRAHRLGGRLKLIHDGNQPLFGCASEPGSAKRGLRSVRRARCPLLLRQRFRCCPKYHPLVGSEELGESRFTKLCGTHLAESTEHSCKVLLGLESTCSGYIEDACIFFYQSSLACSTRALKTNWRGA